MNAADLNKLAEFAKDALAMSNLLNTLAELDPAFIARARGEEIARGVTNWWYLSFASPTRFLGACIVHASGPIDAHTEARFRDLNPGGQVIMAIIPPEQLPAPSYRNRMLSRDDINEFAGPENAKSIRELREEGKL